MRLRQRSLSGREPSIGRVEEGAPAGSWRGAGSSGRQWALTAVVGGSGGIQ